MSFGSSLLSASRTPQPQPHGIEVPQAPTDTISAVSWSPKANFLAASSWDNQTRVWEVQPNGTAMPRAAIQHDAPALCVHWSPDGTKVASGGCDNQARMLDITTGQQATVAAHDAPIKSLRFVQTMGQTVLVTGGWDKAMKFWDLRQQQPIHTYNLGERCYAMDSSANLLVVGTADRKLHIFNLQNPGSPYKVIDSPLKYQTATISCFPSADGFCIGSIEGRCQIQFLDAQKASSSFSFRCHRVDKEVYAVTNICFHPVHGTFATAGSDGTFHFWDKDSRQRLKGLSAVGMPITAAGFNAQGSIYAYAMGYDWGKGHTEHKQGSKVALMLYSCRDEDVKPKQAGIGTKKR
ncbi:WD40 repeat-like protein [Gaertneriomyces semiglobifer]|nr:WD40 repeat-like protein [Gaertneriomyces semiglobifer]